MKPASSFLNVLFLAVFLIFITLPAHASDDTHDYYIYASKYLLNDNAVSPDSESDNTTVSWYAKPDAFDQATEIDDGQPVKSAPGLAKFTFKREFWTAGDRVHVTYVYLSDAAGNCQRDIVKISYTEEERKTAIAAGIIAVFNKFKPFGIAGVPSSKSAYCTSETTITLQKTRATLAIVISPADTANDKKNSPNTVTGTMLTGPMEHWFITTDVLNDGLSQLKYDSTNKTVTEKTTPNNPYIGLNLLWGDPYTDYGGFPSYRRLGLKLLVKPDKPKDAFGLGAGYLFQDNIFDSSSTGSFMCFLALMWSKNDNGGYKQSLRFGLSYNFGSFDSDKK